MENRYMVQYVIEDETVFKIENAFSIFNTMDMDDCYDIRIKDIWHLKESGPKRCQFHGTWHNVKEPLLMTITEGKRVIDSMYGTDH